MPELHDEDTGKPATCPHCDATTGCEHLVAVSDQTFNNCEDGWLSSNFEAFHDVVAAAFRPLLRAEQAALARVAWKDPAVAQLWQSAVDWRDQAEGEVVLDSTVHLRLVIELLELAGADQPRGRFVFDSGPGMSSAMTVLYAEDPAVVGKEALRLLGERLVRKLPRAAPPTRRKSVSVRKKKR